jgi:hypothetical protein
MKRLAMAFALVSALVVPSAHADTCGQNPVQILSFVSVVGDGRFGADLNSAACLAGAEAYVLTPGADTIQLMYDRDLGAEVETLQAHLGGLGFSGDAVTLTRAESTESLTGNTFAFYQSGYIPIPAARDEQGCLRAAVELPDRTVATVAYKTFNGAC